nr:putative 60S ribosomal protein L39-like 5 [Columba livia]
MAYSVVHCTTVFYDLHTTDFFKLRDPLALLHTVPQGTSAQVFPHKQKEDHPTPQQLCVKRGSKIVYSTRKRPCRRTKMGH